MIPAFLATRFGPVGTKIAFFSGIAGLIALALLLAYCGGKKDGGKDEVVKQQEREIVTGRVLAEAAENAASARVEDTREAARQEGLLNAALQATDSPDRQRALRGCVILRQQGRDTANIPACGRSP